MKWGMRSLCYMTRTIRWMRASNRSAALHCYGYSQGSPESWAWPFSVESWPFKDSCHPQKLRRMNWYKTTLEISTRGTGLHDVTETVRTQLRDWNVQEGMCYLFLPHTSASLVVSENWDPTARADLETFMERLVPERDSWYTHD